MSTVISRSIYDTIFDVDNAIIYDETPISPITVETLVNSSPVDATGQIHFSDSRNQSSKWSSNDWSMNGFTVTASFKVPSIVSSTEVTATKEFSGSYRWSEILTLKSDTVYNHTFTVPAYSTVTVRLMTTSGSCNVHFSYTQKDVFDDGQTATYHKDNGTYTGSNSYGFQLEIKSVKNLESGAAADSSDSLVEYPTTVQRIPLSELSVATTATEIVQDAAALPSETVA